MEDYLSSNFFDTRTSFCVARVGSMLIPKTISSFLINRNNMSSTAIMSFCTGFEYQYRLAGGCLYSEYHDCICVAVALFRATTFSSLNLNLIA